MRRPSRRLASALLLCAVLAACAPTPRRPSGYDADIAAGRYALALAKLGPATAEGRPHETRAEAAFLRVMIEGPAAGDAYCRELRNAYPRALAYSTLLCDVVISMVRDGVADAQAIRRLEGHVADWPPHRHVVVEVLRRHEVASR